MDHHRAAGQIDSQAGSPQRCAENHAVRIIVKALNRFRAVPGIAFDGGEIDLAGRIRRTL